uniref:Uncharacterized protein n=1 Tax=Kalanchoe fedtschenkoi TaxID=63787 RepID=A0A7N0TBT7_KALFE
MTVILKAAHERVAFEEMGMVSEAIVCHRNAQIVEVGSNPTHRISTLESVMVKKAFVKKKMGIHIMVICREADKGQAGCRRHPRIW